MTGIARGNWMQTYTGRQFFPLDPHPDDVDPVDIARALSMTCRYGGHVSTFYSVAEHCVLMSNAVSAEAAAWALIHDAAEAYIGDMIRPLKLHMPTFRVAEDRLMSVISEALGIGDLLGADEVRRADTRILLDERAALKADPPAPWDADRLEPLGVEIRAWQPVTAERMWLDRLHDLTLA